MELVSVRKIEPIYNGGDDVDEFSWARGTTAVHLLLSVSPLYIRRISTNEIIKITNVRVATTGRADEERRRTAQEASESLGVSPRLVKPRFPISAAIFFYHSPRQLNENQWPILKQRFQKYRPIATRFSMQFELFMANESIRRTICQTDSRRSDKENVSNEG